MISFPFFHVFLLPLVLCVLHWTPDCNVNASKVPLHIAIYWWNNVVATPRQNTLLVDLWLMLILVFSQHPCLQVLSATYSDPQLRQIIHERRENCSSLADVNADGLPHGFEVARKCRKVSFSTPCDVAASGTNPWAQKLKAAIARVQRLFGWFVSSDKPKA